MNQQKEPEVLAEELIRDSERLIEEAERAMQRTDDYYRDIGAERGLARGFLDSGRVPPEEKAKVTKELAEWQEEVERDIREEQDRFKAESRPSAPPLGLKKGRVRI